MYCSTYTITYTFTSLQAGAKMTIGIHCTNQKCALSILPLEANIIMNISICITRSRSGSTLNTHDQEKRTLFWCSQTAAKTIIFVCMYWPRLTKNNKKNAVQMRVLTEWEKNNIHAFSFVFHLFWKIFRLIDFLIFVIIIFHRCDFSFHIEPNLKPVQPIGFHSECAFYILRNIAKLIR